MLTKNIKEIKKIDIIISFVCIAGFIVSGIIFWQTYNNTLSRLNEEPVGTIVFRKRTAQRRFIDRVVWDRLRQASYIYNGDTIRTIELSEVIISFRDEITYLTLNENTMIQVFYSDLDGARIELSEGILEVDSGSRNTVIISDDSEITISGQTNLTRNQRGFSLSVLEGEAIRNTERLAAGDFLALDANGEPITAPFITMTSFGSSARILAEPGGTAAVVFSWNEHNFTADTHVIVDVALDRGFNRIVRRNTVTNASLISVNVEQGNYWWRAYPVNRGSNIPINDIHPSGILEVIPVSAIQLLSPASAMEHFVPEGADVVFSWTAAEGASAYLIEVSSNADMSDPVVSREVNTARAFQSNLESKRWYWRITPVFPRWITGTHPPSIIGTFFLVHGEPAASEPVPDWPLDNGSISDPEPEAEQDDEPEEEIIQEQPGAVAASQQAQPARTSAPVRTPAPASTTVRGRWSSFVDERSTATLQYSENNQGICTVTVGGDPMRLNPGRASVNYLHTVNQGKIYTYVFEAWTETGTRNLSVVNPSNYETNILITNTRRSYTITSRAMAETAQGSLRFLSANQTGTYFLRIVSITEQD